MPSYAKYLIGSFRELNKSVKSIKNNPYAGNRIIVSKVLTELEALARSLDISGIGYTEVKEKHMFRESVVLFKNAIVFTMEMKKTEIEYAPSKKTNKEVFRTYYELGRAVNLISDFLKNKGYNAHPIPAIGSNLNLSVIGRDSGLGGFGKNGLLITKEFGTSVCLAAVLTDIENLPLNKELNHEWVQKFCNSCNSCVRKCPAGAIYEKAIICEDGSEQHINYRKCAIPFSKQHGCTVCIKECTFFKSNYEKVEKAYAQK